MRKTFTLWAMLGSVFFSTAMAQTPHQRCGTEAMEKIMEQTDPGYLTRKAQNEIAIQQYLANSANAKTNVTRTIPVVFHVVYANASQNISQAMIQSQIDILNEDFRRMNADTTAIPGPFKSLSVDTDIEFCLASVDPQGNPTTGITRTATTAGPFPVGNAIKSNATGGKTPWPNNQYLNIWVGNLSGGTLGFATPPGGSAASDGVVLLYSSVGRAPHNTFPAPYNKGRTATHEVGHYLNLRHVWGDAACGNDMVNDTPTQQGPNYGCPSFPKVTCGNGPKGDMFMNYMDYTDDACMMMFTPGQRDRMIATLTTTRASLLTSTACANTVRANFSANNTTISAGNVVNFTDNSTGAPTSWAWSFPGGNPNTSTLQNPSGIQYNTPGTYPVTLTVTKGTVTDTRTIPNYITVGNSVACIDTLNLPFTGTPTLYISTSNGVKNGYVSGNNTYGDKAKAELFNNVATTINGGLLAFGKAISTSANSSVTVAVWDATGANGKPGAVIASKTVTIGSIAANIAANQLTSVTFNSPVVVTGDFYMGVILPTTVGDTVALITNTAGNSQAGRGWEQDSQNNWDTYTNNWSINISNAIFPIIAGGAPNVGFSANASTVCSGNTVTFNSNATTGANTYSWSFPGGTPSTSTQANPTVTYATPGTYNVTLTANNANCNLSNTLTRNNLITVVAAPPAAPVANFTASATTVCAGTTVTFNSSTTTGATSYSWFFQGASPTSSMAANPTVTYNTPGTYNVTLTATAGTGPCALTHTKTINITVSALPVVNISPASAVLCTSPRQLTASGAATYTWSPATGLNTTTGATVMANPSVTTVYTVTGTTAAGCVSTDTVQVIVPNVSADFTPSGKLFDKKNGPATVTFTNNSVNGATYLWNFGEPGAGTANVSTLQNPPPFTYNWTGTFIVKLEVSANGCTETHRDTIVVRNTTGLADAFETGRIKIYPNPAKTFVQVDIPETERVSAIQLTNAIGQVIATEKPTAGNTRLNVAHLPAGIYFVRITNPEGTIVKKINIEQ